MWYDTALIPSHPLYIWRCGGMAGSAGMLPCAMRYNEQKLSMSMPALPTPAAGWPWEARRLSSRPASMWERLECRETRLQAFRSQVQGLTSQNDDGNRNVTVEFRVRFTATINGCGCANSGKIVYWLVHLRLVQLWHLHTQSSHHRSILVDTHTHRSHPLSHWIKRLHYGRPPVLPFIAYTFSVTVNT